MSAIKLQPTAQAIVCTLQFRAIIEIYRKSNIVILYSANVLLFVSRSQRKYRKPYKTS